MEEEVDLLAEKLGATLDDYAKELRAQGVI